MSEQHDQQKIEQVERLRAPPRTEPERLKTRRSVLARAVPLLARRRRPATWEVLAGWARPGLVAATVALALFLTAHELGRERAQPPGPGDLGEVLAAGSENAAVPDWLVALNEPDADAIVAAAILETNPSRGEQE